MGSIRLKHSLGCDDDEVRMVGHGRSSAVGGLLLRNIQFRDIMKTARRSFLYRATPAGNGREVSRPGSLRSRRLRRLGAAAPPVW